MQADGVIGKYAIGGAIGATFYLEAVSTLDIDIFVSFKNTSESPIISLGPIYDYLTKRGYKPKNEHIIIESWPVQFLPADDALHNEALEYAIKADVEGVPTWVMTSEHLMAIALKTGRQKDFDRINRFINRKVPVEDGAVTASAAAPSTFPQTHGSDQSGNQTSTVAYKKAFDDEKLNQILARNGLIEKWEKFEREYLRNES